jgi:hypothetical protein
MKTDVVVNEIGEWDFAKGLMPSDGQHVEIALEAEPGEIPMHPWYGCGLTKRLNSRQFPSENKRHVVEMLKQDGYSVFIDLKPDLNKFQITIKN